jgi:hypothetical protein
MELRASPEPRRHVRADHLGDELERRERPEEDRELTHEPVGLHLDHVQAARAHPSQRGFEQHDAFVALDPRSDCPIRRRPAYGALAAS